ncbi:4'-phosphopantetheinyl transferase family protein [Thermomonas fusca]|uniref:4'-phosphopantetheinyl transferase superfamily protein n=1 Tax=Thermomonas fusca TaxID=215690 RepID=A0A5R9PCH0_9GAMM|nr:4'-phosphopantetheinyl transferase superfamily protein [Thermomonas fusca]TLX21239.1 4'-phosphopantetheinyl transferase superfamily protein [Thermomonas fusca]
MAAARLHLLPVAAAAAEAGAQGLDWLTAAECRRLQAITSASRRDTFLAGHWQARALAAQWLRLDVGRVALDAQADGRPLLRVDGDAAPLHLSLSHSGGWLALALADAPVGVDIELPRRVRDWNALARFVFSPEECRRVDAAGDALCAEVFHALWTLKEARGKRSGEGLQPRAARAVTAQPADAANAEALGWAFGEGALALALAPGTRLERADGVPGTPAYWRFSSAAGDPRERD